MDEEKKKAEVASREKDQVSAPPAREETPSQEETQEAVPETQKPKGTVLLIEDDLTMIKMYSTKLKLEGFQVEFAEDGEAGLEKLQSIKAVGLVILDLMIPKVGGMEVLEKVRSETKFKNLPVIILSNLSQEADIKRATALGVKHFLIKSNYTPSQVVQIVKSYFDGGQPVPEIKPRGDGAMLNSTAEPTVPNSEESEATPPGS